VVVGRTGPPPEQLDRAGAPFARVLSVDEVRFYETCNVFYRRCDLVSERGFDERYRQPGGEDTDLALRVVAAGSDAVFEPEALVHHDVRTSNWVAALRETLRWTDVPLVLRLHPGSRRRLLHRWVFWKPSHPPAIWAAAGLLAATRWRPALLLALPWLRHRLWATPVAAQPLLRVVTLPGALAIDLVEVGVMVRGSLRHHTIVL
jgi:GT2 family glycosyltransferase